MLILKGDTSGNVGEEVAAPPPGTAGFSFWAPTIVPPSPDTTVGEDGLGCNEGSEGRSGAEASAVTITEACNADLLGSHGALPS